MKDTLLAATRLIDDGRPEEARGLLRSLPLVEAQRAERFIAVGLWKRLTSHPENAASVSSSQDALALLDRLGAAVADRTHMPDAYAALPGLQDLLGPADAAAIVASTLWDRVLECHPTLFVSVFELFFSAGGERCAAAMEEFMAKRADYVPDCWHLVLLTKITSVQNADFAALTRRLLHTSGRLDLAPLFAVYRKQVRQAPVGDIVEAACALRIASHRLAVVQDMIYAGYTSEELAIVVAAFPDLAGNGDHEAALNDFMQARLAISERRWRDAIDLANKVSTDDRVACAADLFRALALSRLGHAREASSLLNGVAANPRAQVFERAKVAHLRVTTALLERGLTLPEDRQPPQLAISPKPPVAQSLWIGPRLRWIERLCIQSYLANGWRFHLYVYDPPQDVPEGCELHDAAAIIPRESVFVESNASGVHVGSVGAFSDLFRYRLLALRGGLWTDTDVINVTTYDPSDLRFVCTEISDAGLITINGAIMAAPAGDEFANRAYERARAALAEHGMFFTRIGPFLLAELAFDMGVDQVTMMPPRFLGPITAMNASSLLLPYDEIATRPDFQGLTNIHTYTETYRVLGFRLDRRPGPETFLGHLYANHFPEAGGSWAAARS